MTPKPLTDKELEAHADQLERRATDLNDMPHAFKTRARLHATISAQQSVIKSLREALIPRAYAQGNDEGGWYRRCDLCDEQTRTPFRGSVRHKTTCPLAAPTSPTQEGEA